MRVRCFGREQGSVFLTAVMVAGVFAILTVGILTYLSNEYSLNFRSHTWNRALHLVEAAIEKSFSELNYYTAPLGAGGFTTDRGWYNISSGVYSNAVINFTDGAGNVVGNFYSVVSGVGGFTPSVTAVAVCAGGSSGPSITRAVQVKLKAASRFPTSLMSTDWMDMNGNNIYVDSYDSTDVAKSTSGRYDSSKRQSNGNVASNGTVMNTMNVGNAEIHGVAYTGTGGSVALGSNGSIGPTFVAGDRSTTVNDALSKGWIQTDFNLDIPDVTLPTGATTWGGAPGASGSGIGSITKDNTLSTGNYRVNDISLNSSAHGDDLVINGNVSLYVLGNVSISGLGRIIINSNASLTIYVAGSVSVAGLGLVNNTGTPIKNQWYGLPSSTSWSYTGNANWTGVIYAPSAALAFKGGGSSGDASGAAVAKSITLAGQVQFHYDESLRAANTGAGYQVASWQELRNINGVWSP